MGKLINPKDLLFFLIMVDLAYVSSSKTSSLIIETTLISPSIFFLRVNLTSVPLGPLINLIASSSLIPITPTGSWSAWPTFIISSPISIFLSLQTGPPKIISTISIPPSFLDNRAPIPSNLPEMFMSKRSLASGWK